MKSYQNFCSDLQGRFEMHFGGADADDHVLVDASRALPNSRQGPRGLSVNRVMMILFVFPFRFSLLDECVDSFIGVKGFHQVLEV